MSDSAAIIGHFHCSCSSYVLQRGKVCETSVGGAQLTKVQQAVHRQVIVHAPLMIPPPAQVQLEDHCPSATT